MKPFFRVIIMLLFAVNASASVTVTANFSYIIKYGCVADTVVFTNTSLGANVYSWSFGDHRFDTAANPTHVYLLQGTDTVTLYASNDSTIDSVTEYISHEHPLVASFTTDTNIICQGGAITFTNTSIDSIPTYLWVFGDGNIDDAVNTTHKYTQSGVYNAFLVVTDFVPCMDTFYKKIMVDTISSVGISVTDTIICEGTYITFTGSYAGIGNTGVAWSFGNGDSIKNVNPVIYGYHAPGAYTVSATALYRACPNPTGTRTITVIQQPIVNIGNDTAICIGGAAISLVDNINKSSAGATWMWSTGETTPSITVVKPGVYSVTVKEHGCEATGTVNVSNDCFMSIPNGFTPNDDGVNDYFYPRQYLSSGLIAFHMDIYNRWGELVFETASLDGSGWDGKFNGVPQPLGVYVYVVDGTFKDGQHEHHQGNVSLLR